MKTGTTTNWDRIADQVRAAYKHQRCNWYTKVSVHMVQTMNPSKLEAALNYYDQYVKGN